MSRRRLIPLLLVFSGLAFYQINLPGLHYDEAFEIVPAMQLLKNQPVQAFRAAALTVGGKTLPLTTQDYIGAVNTYGSLPFLALGGISVAGLRAYAIAVGLITLLLVYGLTAELTRYRPAGLAAVALLAANPTFVFWSRQGVFVTAVTAAIGVGAAWAWLKWWRSKQFKWTLAGAFLFGVGMYAKLLFVWLIPALLAGFVIHRLAGGHFSQWKHPRQTLSALLPRPAPSILKLIAAFGLGCWPLILYNIQTGGTFKSIGQNAGTSYYGVNNAAILPNLAARLQQLMALLSGGHLWYVGNVYTNPLPLIAFGLMLAAALGLAWQRQPLGLAVFAVIGVVVLESIVTVSALWITHFALIMVWPAIALAVTGAELYRHFPQRRFLPTALLAGLLLVALSDGLTTGRYHQALNESGGLSDHSDAVYDMAAWLDQNATGPVVAMDWGLAASVTYLTEGRVRPVEVFGYDWQVSGRFDDIIGPYLAPGAAVFLWRAPAEIIFDRSADFKRLYRPLDLEEDILAAFYERNGRPIFGVTQLVPVGSAKNRPQ